VTVPVSEAAVPLTVQRQERSEWCWAAVSVSVDLLFRPASAHTQCDVASLALALACCGDGKPAACNVPHELNTVLGRLHLLAGDPLRTPVPFTQIRKEIDSGRPVCILIKWLDRDGSLTRGHFIAVNGYRITPAGKQFVSITDPFFGSSHIDYDQLSNPKGGYQNGRGVWFASFLVENKAAERL
jgi:hypothetical protein